MAVENGCYFDLRAAERARYFFSAFLRHSIGQFAGKPFELLPWQWERVIAPLFGWRRPDGLRRFRRAGIAIAKKNGKSTLLSGIGCYMLVGDGEPGAEVYSAAADREQAAIIFREMASMVKASPELDSRLKVRASGKRIMYPQGHGVYKALSADVPTKEGLNIHCLLFDELHAQKTWDLWNALKYGGASRRQPLYLWISTAGHDSQSLCRAQWKYAEDVLSGAVIDEEFLPCIYQPAPGDDWKSEETWKKANPSYGITILPESFAADCKAAQACATDENAFRRYRLNQWTTQETRWLQVDRWEACRELYSFADYARGQQVYAGFDLSAISDLTALVFLSRDADGRWRIWPMFWAPQAVSRKRDREGRTRIDGWVRQGFIRTTPGDVIDYARIRKDFRELACKLNVREVAFDPWNATQFSTDLQAEGFHVKWVKQGFFSLSKSTKELEKLVLAKGIIHPGNPVLDWMIGNVAVETDAAGNIKPSKRRSGEKIDGVSALVTVLASAIEKPFGKKSKYEEGGLTVV